MGLNDEIELDSTSLYAHSKSNIVRLTVAQALSGANAVVVYATGAIVGNMLAPDRALATLPITIFVLGMTACSLPAGMIAQRYGRRTAFLLGTVCGVLIGLVSALAVVMGSFWLFCLAMLFGGAYWNVPYARGSRPLNGWQRMRKPIFLASWRQPYLTCIWRSRSVAAG